MSVRRWLLGGAVFLAVGIPVVAQAMRERRETRAMFAELEALQANLQPLARHVRDGRRIVINGAPIFFRTSTVQGSIDDALAGVAGECRSGERRTMLGGAPPREGDTLAVAGALELVRVDRQSVAGASASLCVFRERNSGTLVRYTMAKRVDDATTSVITIATESSAPFESLYPDEGDAPGGDFEGVPRPKGSRRVFAASVEGEPYGVRMYESESPLRDTVAEYDAEMAAHRWTSSKAVADAMPAARLYQRDSVEMIASFGTNDGHTVTTVAPLQ